MRMKTCMKSRPNLKLHSFQTVVVVVSSSRLVLPGALGLGPVLCPVLWGIGRRATATPANLRAFARIDSCTLQVGVMFGSSQPPFRCSDDHAKLVHLSQLHTGACRHQWVQTFGGAPLAGSFSALTNEYIAVSFVSAAITWRMAMIDYVQTQLAAGVIGSCLIAGLVSCGGLQVPLATR